MIAQQARGCILSIVEFFEKGDHDVHYLCMPCQKEPGFEASSVNYGPEVVGVAPAALITTHLEVHFDMHVRRKLIEVALPLDAINEASAKEKRPESNPHPRGVHLWWARRPLCAARAVLFSQLVDDPSEYVDELLADRHKRALAEQVLRDKLKDYEQKRANIGEEEILEAEPTLKTVIEEIERKRLFGIIEKMVLWKDADFEKTIESAQEEIWRSWRRICANNKDHPRAQEIFDPEKLPAFHDPFAGGGTLPLEASRLGLESHAGDLNPVAVLINKAMIEIPPKFANRPPVNPISRSDKNWFDREWRGMDGIAEDIVYYSQWIRDELEDRIGHHYPKVVISAEMVEERPELRPYMDRELPMIAWLWARTVKSPNPAFSDVHVPLVSNFILSTKARKEVYIEPVIEGDHYRFIIKTGHPIDLAERGVGTKIGKGKFRCLISGTPIETQYIRNEFKAKRSGVKLMAIIADGSPGRVYLNPTPEHEKAAFEVESKWRSETPLSLNPRAISPPLYGFNYIGDLFSDRQFLALTIISDLIGEVKNKIYNDAISVNILNDNKPLRDNGTGAKGYVEAISVYLSFVLDRCADFSNSFTRWTPGGQVVKSLFSKQAIPMVWDFSEVAILNETVGGIVPTARLIAKNSKEISAGGGGMLIK